MIKMVADARTEEVLGVSIVGNSAGEVIHEAAIGVRFHAKINDFRDLLHVYPTMAEALKIAAISRWKDPARLFLLRKIVFNSASILEAAVPSV
jgi:mercuric reductase